jgi:replicative DNA helicase
MASHPPLSGYEDQDRELAHVRLPPHSIEAEQSVLGGLILHNGVWEEVGDLLAPDDFYRKDHRLIFQALSTLLDADRPADALTAADQLTRDGALDEAGGQAYLARLAGDTPSTVNVRAWATLVREASVLRQLIGVSRQIADASFEPEGRDVSTVLEEAERSILEIGEARQKQQGGFQSVRAFLPATVSKLQELHEAEGDVSGLSTGFKRFDELTGGLQAGDLVIIAGRPSMGKTTLAMNIAENAACGDKRPVAVFSMEMGAQQLILRHISSLGKVNQAHLRRGTFHANDWNRITGAMGQLQEAPIYIDDAGGLTPTEIRARTRRLRREVGGDLGLIVVDYIQLMTVAGTTENRATELSAISRSLKALAKEMNCPLIALSQLNRSVEQRPDKRPIMSDLRESGAIEQDADLICFIYRDEVYNKDTDKKNMADIIIAKQRNGPIDDFVLTFLGEFTKFENYAPERDAGFMGG